MLYKDADRAKTYKELIDKLAIGKNRASIYEEITHFCESCHPLSPITCVDLCEIWKLKKAVLDCGAAPIRSKFVDLLNTARNNTRLKILEILVEGPHSQTELGHRLKEVGNCQKLAVPLENHIQSLVEVDFIKKHNAIYEITPRGEKIFNILTKSKIATLPLDFSTHDEKILNALSSGPKSYDELVKIISSGSIFASLKRLQRKGLVVKPRSSGRIFYFKTKRRPTRKLSPIEMKIFKALPKEGISARDLGEKIGVDVKKIYRYLRRLQYKRHTKKEAKPILYYITETGRTLVESMKIARKSFLEYSSLPHNLSMQPQFLN